MNPKLLIGATLRSAIERFDAQFPKLGFRFKRDFFAPDMSFSLRVLHKCGFRPTHAVDVGAFEGEWAQTCRAVFGPLPILMVEPAHQRHAALARLCREHEGLRYVGAFLAAEAGNVHFREQLTNSGGVPKASADTIELPTTTLDLLLREAGFPAAELLKVDTQGYDLEVLKGASKMLQSVEVIITEMSLIPLAAKAPSFRDFIDWLDGAGFRLFDICGFMRRPVDDALWQIDAIFVRKDSKLGARELGWSR